MRMKFALVLVVVLSTINVNNINSALAEKSNSNYSNGLKAFKSKNYSLAISNLEKHLKGKKPDPTTIYFLALANLHSNNRARARQLFNYIEKHFPNSKEARHSRTALKLWNKSPKTNDLPTPRKSKSTSESKTTNNLGRFQGKRLVHSNDEEYLQEFTSIPKYSKVRVRFAKGQYVLQGSVKGQNIFFQRGNDWDTKISLKDLEKLRIAKPTRPADDIEYDEKHDDKIPCWKMTLKIKIGQIARKVPIKVLKYKVGLPELGTSFFEDLKTEYSSFTLTVSKKTHEKTIGKQAKISQYKNAYTKLPDRTEIRFKDGNQGHMLVNAKINGHPIKCMFDTGASGYFGLNHLKSVGISKPNRSPDSYATGWSGTRVPIWRSTASVTIGGMTRTIPISIARNWRMPPLVGQEFMRDYQYSIDRKAGRMSLWKKTVASKQSTRKIHSHYDVKCVVKNDREYVTLVINGSSVPNVLIDTGAAGTIISKSAARNAGITIPANARTKRGGGIGGSISYKEIFVRASLGPVNHQSFPIKIGGNAGSAIGQDFMSGWRFSVDRDKQLLRFFH